MEALDAEVHAAQAARHDLMKWKLAVIAAVGAAALGFSQSRPVANAHLALCTIPFACAYLDLLCRNLSVRTKLITTFRSLGRQGPDRDDDRLYEAFYAEYHSLWGRRSLESFALLWSTILVSFIVALAGIGLATTGVGTIELATQELIFRLVGLVGIGLGLIVQQLYESRTKSIKVNSGKWYGKAVAACGGAATVRPE